MALVASLSEMGGDIRELSRAHGIGADGELELDIFKGLLFIDRSHASRVIVGHDANTSHLFMTRGCYMGGC